MGRSILTERLARRGCHLTYEYTGDPFEAMRAGEIKAHPVHTLPGSMARVDALFFATETGVNRHKSDPVIDESGRVIGLVS